MDYTHNENTMGSLNGRTRIKLDLANYWGFHDLTGNNSEWVWDGYCQYADLPNTDPICEEQTDYLRTIRGYTDGDFTYQRLTSRQWAFNPFGEDSAPKAGIRLVRTLKD